MKKKVFMLFPLVLILSCDPIGLKDTIDEMVLGWTRSVTLISPADEAEIAEKTPLLDWEDSGGATSYEVQIAEAEDQLDGADIITVSESGYEYPEALTISDQKYWRVRALKDSEAGPWSEARSFEIIPSTDPQVIGSLDVGGGGYRIQLKEDYAFLARIENGVTIVDISDKTNPVLAGSITGIETSHDLAVSGNYLYVLDVTDTLNPKQFKVYDISNCASPLEIASADLSYGGNTYKAGSHAFAFHGSSLYAPLRKDTGDGDSHVIGQFDISDPENPSLDYVRAITDDGFDIAVSGNLLLYTQPGGGTGVDPGLGAINLVGDGGDFLEIPGMLSGFIQIYQNYACVSDLNGPVRFVDLTDPSSLSVVSTFDNGGGTTVGGIVGKYLYVSNYSTGASDFVDISDPARPVLYSSISEGLNIFSIEGNYAYGLDYTEPGTFYVIDLIPGE